MAHALVTGGAGFIGSHLVDRLLAEGWRVTVVDNFDPYYDPALKRRNVREHLRCPGYRLLERDLRDLEGLRANLTESLDVVVHLAAKAGVRASIEDPVAFQQVNIGGTQNLLELARERGIGQFVFASSSSVYGVNPNVPWRESDHVLLPISPYAATKVSGELLGHVYSRLHGIRFLALRFFNVYGPRQRPDQAMRKMSRLVAEGAPLPIYGDGHSLRDYTYVGDVIDGVRRAMDYRDSGYEVINLGSHCPVSLLEMVRLLAGALSAEPRLEFHPEQPGDVPQTYADVRKAKALLGFEPATDLPSGLARMAAWLRES
ncbi:MAG: NAD-dependent epimerase/dehydratase family protein [Bryobacteraceae bacterium]